MHRIGASYPQLGAPQKNWPPEGYSDPGYRAISGPWASTTRGPLVDLGRE